MPISWGELLDKISILQIKNARIGVPEKLFNVRTELNALVAARDRALPRQAALEPLCDELDAINGQLWDLENQLRALDRAQLHDSRFVELARTIRRLNDRRSAVKYDINQATNSRLVEEKHYSTEPACDTAPPVEAAGS